MEQTGGVAGTGGCPGMNAQVQQLQNIRLCASGDAVVILDQTRLPNELVYLRVETKEAMFEAIRRLRVRGAPAIGIFAAYAMYCAARRIKARAFAPFLEEFRRIKDYFAAARPTAVNLTWALERMERVVVDNVGRSVDDIKAALGCECKAIHDEDRRMCRSIAEHGLSLVRAGDGVLTHCNAGPLATSEYGTALGPLLLARERGMDVRAFACETRPLLQGARLTAYELMHAGIDVTLICDNMAGMVIKNGWVQACFVGCDRVARNGDVANKIGTGALAVLAKHYGIPFYVLGPTSSIDMSCATGDEIDIELRDGSEITELHYVRPMAPQGVKCYNPAFDVTDHALITAIVTEKGICRPPFAQSIAALFP
jgi:methylthioribose-1-phosphate isomerase